MCTAVCFQDGGFYFGRNLDYERSYGEGAVVMPRRFPIHMRGGGVISEHYAIVGTAHTENAFPLFYDAMNECGLCIAALNFVGNAYYPRTSDEGKEAVAQFEFIPYLLGRCGDIFKARECLEEICITAAPFSDKFPPSPLHWLIADKHGCITLECERDGMHIYDNPVGVLTNNPQFPAQLFSLCNYRSLSARSRRSTFCGELEFDEYSRGMGALGLPGDFSSQSRFVRAAFVALNSSSEKSEKCALGRMFHVLETVGQVRGCCELDGGACEYTLYTSVFDAEHGIYCFTTYENRRIRAVDLNRENLNSEELRVYPMYAEQEIKIIN